MFWVDDRDIISQWVDTQCSFKTKSLNMLPDLGRPKNYATLKLKPASSSKFASCNLC